MSRETETHTERDGGLRTDSEPLHRTVQGRGFELDRGGRGYRRRLAGAWTRGNRISWSPGSLRPPGRAREGPATPLSRRSLALADDAAFRERARLLAALERRHWLNSYMHKLLVLDAP